jgi:tRNA A-37 threonylcarbamoyl transferase component Bud32
MADDLHCPECGTALASDAPLGLCPACLIGMAWIQPTAGQNATTDGSPVDPDPVGPSGPGPDRFPDSLPEWAFASRDRMPPGPRDATGSDSSTVDEDSWATDDSDSFATRSGVLSDPAPPDSSSGEGFGPPGYEVLEELGRGGMGVVYKARQATLNRLVALKMIRGEAEASQGQLERFRIEAEAVARLRHPNVVQIYEVGEVRSRPYFSLELLEGGSLADRIAGIPQSARPSAELLATLARAMQAAHDAGVVHRDLKPQNVLFDRDGTPKVTDFGLAKRLDVEGGLTMTYEVMGTPSYMAPEQALGKNREVGPPADVYALGAILYSMLTGRPPLQGTTWRETLLMVAEQEPVPPSRIQPKIPRDLETICLKCLAKEPGRRYASAGELAEDLERFSAGRTILARRTPHWERGLKWVRRHPTAATLLALALAGSIGGIVAAERANDEARRRVAREDDRVAKLRREGSAELFKAKEQLARGELDDSRVVLTRLLATIPPKDKLDEVRGLASATLEEVQHKLESRAKVKSDRDRYAQFVRLTDEALLQDTMAAGLAEADKTDRTRDSARAALSIFEGEAQAPSADALTEAERVRIASDGYMLHLVLAGAIVRTQPGENPARQAAEALAIAGLPRPEDRLPGPGRRPRWGDSRAAKGGTARAFGRLRPLPARPGTPPGRRPLGGAPAFRPVLAGEARPVLGAVSVSDLPAELGALATGRGQGGAHRLPPAEAVVRLAPSTPGHRLGPVGCDDTRRRRSIASPRRGVAARVRGPFRRRRGRLS